MTTYTGQWRIDAVVGTFGYDTSVVLNAPALVVGDMLDVQLTDPLGLYVSNANSMTVLIPGYTNRAGMAWVAGQPYSGAIHTNALTVGNWYRIHINGLPSAASGMWWAGNLTVENIAAPVVAAPSKPLNQADGLYFGNIRADAAYMGTVKVWPAGIPKPTLEWVFNDGTTQGWRAINIGTQTENPDGSFTPSDYSLIDPGVSADYIYTDGGALQRVSLNLPTRPVTSSANFVFHATGLSVPAGVYHLVLEMARDEDPSHFSVPEEIRAPAEALYGFMTASFGPANDTGELAANLSYLLGKMVMSVHDSMPVLFPAVIDPASMPTPEQPDPDRLLAWMIARNEADEQITPENFAQWFTLDSYTMLGLMAGSSPAIAHDLSARLPEEVEAARKWTSSGIEHPGGPIDLTIVVYILSSWPWKLKRVAITDEAHTPAPATGKMFLSDPNPLEITHGIGTFFSALKSSLPSKVPDVPPPPLVFPTPSLDIEWTFTTGIEGATGLMGVLIPSPPTWGSDGTDGWLSQNSPGSVKALKHDVHLEPGSYRTRVEFAMGAGRYDDPTVWKWYVTTRMTMQAEGYRSYNKDVLWASAPGYGIPQLTDGRASGTGWMTMTTDTPLVTTERMLGTLSVNVELFRTINSLIGPDNFRVTKISLLDANGNVVRT